MGEPARHLSLEALPELLADALRSAFPERGLRIDQVCERTGLGRATIYRMVKGGDFPAGRKSGEATLWLESEVSAWLRGLPRAG